MSAEWIPGSQRWSPTTGGVSNQPVTGMLADMAEQGFAPIPEVGRRFGASRRVRLGDADRHGRLRLDALARLLQDVGHDDFVDAGLDPAAPFVARRSTVWSPRWPRIGDRLSLVTFCGGLGSRWAERRTSITVVDRGSVHPRARVEIATVWVFLDERGRPAPLPEWFVDTYGTAAAGRKVSARLSGSRPDEAAVSRPWAMRATDLDVLGHVNNAATWAAVEDELGRHDLLPTRAVLEYGAPIELTDEIRLSSRNDPDDASLLIWLTCGDEVRATGRVSCSQGPNT